MQTQTENHTRKFACSVLFGLLVTTQFVLPAHADWVGIANYPLYTTVLVKPNIAFIFDDSSSMDYAFLPDDVPRDGLFGNPDLQKDSHAVALTSAQCNGLAYNPAITYLPPVDSAGKAMTEYPFTAAPGDGYTGGSAPNLNGPPVQFYYVYNPPVGQPRYPALSYEYDGAGFLKIINSPFFDECNNARVAVSGTRDTTNKFDKKTSNNWNPTEKQNYANWYSYYRTRLLMMKTLAGRSFRVLKDDFRVGFSTTGDLGTAPSTTFLPIADFGVGTGNMKDPTKPQDQKDKFYAMLYYGTNADAGALPQRFTPLRGALSKAGRIYAGKVPSVDPMQLSCQQNFAVLVSDGYWNSFNDASTSGPFDLDMQAVGDQDGNANRPMRDGISGPAPPNTLADVAMYYFETDLRGPPTKSGNTCVNPSGTNLCPVKNNQYSPNVPFPADDTRRKVTPHMSTFTVGLSMDGMVKNYSPTYATDPTGDYHDISLGLNNKNWPSPFVTVPGSSGEKLTSSPYDDALPLSQFLPRIDDLWHAAVNGNGTYFRAKDPTTSSWSLGAALAGVAKQLGYGSGGAASSGSPTTTDNAFFVASYTTVQWTGNLVSQSIGTDGAVNTALAWCVENMKDEANHIDCTGTLAAQVASDSPPQTGRKIYFNKILSGNPTLVSFEYANLPTGSPATCPTSLQACFGNTIQQNLSQYLTIPMTAAQKSTAFSGLNLVLYLRGQTPTALDENNHTTTLYRKREATLGDIVDTQPVFVGRPVFAYTEPSYAAFKVLKKDRPRTVYVGANEGMVHAFNADINSDGTPATGAGKERWAFVPTPVMANMYRLADDNYVSTGGAHRNFVNGRLFYADVCETPCTTAAHWHTILVGGLGSGGRGYFALDVTDPANPSMLWEFTSANDKDLGYSFGNPLAMKKADQTWVVVLSSGYDNGTRDNNDAAYAAAEQGDGKAHLFVLNALTGAKISKIDVPASLEEGTQAAPSGLSRIAYWADNPEQNPTARNAYGADLKGNLFRFNINCTSGTVSCSTVICQSDDLACDPTKPVTKLAKFTDVTNAPQPITTRPELTTVGTNRMVFVATGKYLEASDRNPDPVTNKYQKQSLYAIVDGGTTVTNPRSLAQRKLTDAGGVRTVISQTDDKVKDPLLGWFVDFPEDGERSNLDMRLIRGTLLVPTNIPTNDLTCESGGTSWLTAVDYSTGLTASGASDAGVWFGNDLTTGINVIWVNGVPEVIRTGNATRPTPVRNVSFSAGSAGVTGHRVGWREIFKK